MSSPLYNAMGKQSGINSDMVGVINRFRQFKQTFQGNPEQTVMGMLNSGMITQEQLNRFQEMSRMLSGILK